MTTVSHIVLCLCPNYFIFICFWFRHNCYYILCTLVDCRLWTPKVRYALEDIERIVGNVFEWLPAPQPCDVMTHCAEQMAEEISEVDSAVFSYFRAAADKLISKLGAENALCAALAQMSGFTTKPPARSLLSSTDGMVTVQFASKVEINSHGYVFGNTTIVRIIILCKFAHHYLL